MNIIEHHILIFVKFVNFSCASLKISFCWYASWWGGIALSLLSIVINKTVLGDIQPIPAQSLPLMAPQFYTHRRWFFKDEEENQSIKHGDNSSWSKIEMGRKPNPCQSIKRGVRFFIKGWGAISAWSPKNLDSYLDQERQLHCKTHMPVNQAKAWASSSRAGAALVLWSLW